MTNKELMKIMYKNGKSYSEIGRILGVSRQRVHQVIKNYKNIGKKNRESFYEKFDKCKICCNPAIALHHIDKDNTNDKPENLIPVCKDCHYKLHLLTTWARDYDSCIECGTTDRLHIAKGLCSLCWGRLKRPHIKRFKWSLKYERCISCSTTEIQHHSKGLCDNCYANQLYHKKFRP